MNWSENFTHKCCVIKASADEMLSNATMLEGMRYATPSMAYYEAQSAARTLREAADKLDVLALRMAPLRKRLIAAE